MGADYEAAKEAMKNGNPQPKSYQADVKLDFKKNMAELVSTNVIGFLEGSDKKDEFVFITAHYDHLGKRGDSVIYYGADDDGSGTVSVLELAEGQVGQVGQVGDNGDDDTPGAMRERIGMLARRLRRCLEELAEEARAAAGTGAPLVPGTRAGRAPRTSRGGDDAETTALLAVALLGGRTGPQARQTLSGALGTLPANRLCDNGAKLLRSCVEAALNGERKRRRATLRGLDLTPADQAGLVAALSAVRAAHAADSQHHPQHPHHPQHAPQHPQHPQRTEQPAPTEKEGMRCRTR